MKKRLVFGLFLISLINLYGSNSVNWRDYLPSKVRCFLSATAVNASRSFQIAVTAYLATEGDSEAVEAWQSLVNTYSPTELMCMFGAQDLNMLASELSNVLPSIPGLSWTVRQGLESAFRFGVNTARKSMWF